MSKKIRFNTIGLSTVTNAIRAVLINNASPSAIEQEIDEAYPHPDRYWNFYGLVENENYTIKFQQDVAGTWVDIPGYNFTFTADSAEVTALDPVMVQVDHTTGLTSGIAVAVFDGTGSPAKADWRGYNMFPQRLGAGPMKPATEYSWDPTSGTFTLLAADDLFQPNEYFFIQFGVIVSASGGGQIVSGKLFIQTKLITADYSILSGDFATKLVVNGSGSSVALTLPDVFTIPENKLLYIESGVGSHRSVILNTYSNDQIIDWLEGNRIAIYMGRCEQLAVYKQIIDSTHHVWRIHEPEGNFKTRGRTFHSYNDVEEEMNAVYLDGRSLSVAAYPRLYYEVVLKMDPSKVCSFSTHGTGNNKYKYSFKNISGNFYIPDTRDLFIRNTGASRDAAIFQDHAIARHRHESPIGTLATSLFGRGILSRLRGLFNGSATGFTDLTGDPVDSGGNDFPNMDSETRPANITENHFVLV